MNQNPQYNQSRQSQGSASRGNAFIRTWNWLCLNIVVPYLDNCSAELISKSSQVSIRQKMFVLHSIVTMTKLK